MSVQSTFTLTTRLLPQQCLKPNSKKPAPSKSCSILVTDANFECNEENIMLQAMDNSHIALVSVEIGAPGFTSYRCDRTMPLGVDLTSLTKVLRCAKDENICTLKAADEADVLNLVYDAKSAFFSPFFFAFMWHGRDASSPFPPFFLLCSALLPLFIHLNISLSSQTPITSSWPETKYDTRVTLPSAEFTRIVRDLSQLGEHVRIEVSKEVVRISKLKAKSSAEDEDNDSIPTGVVIEMNQHVSLTFSLKYLVNFSKSGSLSGEVQLLMSNDVPLLVAYDFTQGYIRCYLAPKIGDD
ncbi:hypothetical protein CVT25_008375 [Psilocybe cyanescens]|uniref:DNA sliding clamp PCNA n=1 Tax=Psilocybe cyanescens TaxID=93625 RepID=A0A409XVC8_PSICY|nr:hypothetical protein CVT25_008375 [Psilocybe cyanescens]